MTKIPVSDAAVEAGLRASYMLMCERESMPFSEDEFLGALNGDLERRDVAKAMMRAAIEAALPELLEEIPQTYTPGQKPRPATYRLRHPTPGPDDANEPRICGG